MTRERCRLVEIKQPIRGFDGFIGSWVYQGNRTFLVDVGPANSVGNLMTALEDMGVDHVDFVLLTHIHLDHAGAIGTVLKRFPMAQVICHDKGVDHIVDPEKLWKGSLKVLKERAEAFGKPDRVDRGRVIGHSEASVPGLHLVDTPGHAPHHCCYVYKGFLFSGEAAGNYYVVGNGEFLRPATPPRLFLDMFLKSVDKLLALDDHIVCYGHFGKASGSHAMVKRFRSQMLRWEEIIGREIQKDFPDMVSHCVDCLLKKDPELKAYEQMPLLVQMRERYFMANSVRGFLGYLKGEV